jgi:predicted transcriptional regulator of viral defense system
MNLHAFFARHPVFTTHDLDVFLADSESPSLTPNEQARKKHLRYHQKRGHLIAVRRGLWAAVAMGHDAATYPVDSFLIAARMTDDAVLAYHAALALHGVAHSVLENRVCLSGHGTVRPFTFRGVTYRAVRPPGALVATDGLALGVEEQDRQGLTIRVTTLERTLVDVLDRPDLAGGWEEAWRSLEGLDVYLDLDFAVHYTLLLQNATTAGKVGYFLETQRDRLFVEDRHLEALRLHAPKTPHYAVPASSGNRAPARLVSAWNLRVPVLKGELGGDGIQE